MHVIHSTDIFKHYFVLSFSSDSDSRATSSAEGTLHILTRQNNTYAVSLVFTRI